MTFAKAAKSHFASRANGVTRFALGYQELGDTPILLPPREQQKGIVAFLDEKTAQIDKVLTLRGTNIDQISGGAIAKLVKALLEYRSALITAAVTGQIDVSGAA